LRQEALKQALARSENGWNTTYSNIKTHKIPSYEAEEDPQCPKASSRSYNRIKRKEAKQIVEVEATHGFKGGVLSSFKSSNRGGAELSMSASSFSVVSMGNGYSDAGMATSSSQTIMNTVVDDSRSITFQCDDTQVETELHIVRSIILRESYIEKLRSLCDSTVLSALEQQLRQAEEKDAQHNNRNATETLETPENKKGVPLSRSGRIELLHICSILRESSVEIIEKVCAWRAKIGQASPFMYKDINYLLKMSEDLDFVSRYGIIVTAISKDLHVATHTREIMAAFTLDQQEELKKQRVVMHCNPFICMQPVSDLVVQLAQQDSARIADSNSLTSAVSAPAQIAGLDMVRVQTCSKVIAAELELQFLLLRGDSTTQPDTPKTPKAPKTPKTPKTQITRKSRSKKAGTAVSFGAGGTDGGGDGQEIALSKSASDEGDFDEACFELEATTEGDQSAAPPSSPLREQATDAAASSRSSSSKAAASTGPGQGRAGKGLSKAASLRLERMLSDIEQSEQMLAKAQAELEALQMNEDRAQTEAQAQAQTPGGGGGAAAAAAGLCRPWPAARCADAQRSALPRGAGEPAAQPAAAAFYAGSASAEPHIERGGGVCRQAKCRLSPRRLSTALTRARRGLHIRAQNTGESRAPVHDASVCLQRMDVCCR
jgi:hypothetical protein